MTRVFTAALATETNTFSPLPTDIESFREQLLARPGEHPDRPTIVTGPIIAARRLAGGAGWTLIEGTAASAAPGGTLNRSTYESLRDEILGQMAAAMPLDAVVLGLHGAMVAHGYPDCEGDILSRARALSARMRCSPPSSTRIAISRPRWRRRSTSRSSTRSSRMSISTSGRRSCWPW